MDSESAQDVRLLLGQDERTAGGMMTVSCVEARAGQTAAAVLDSMRPITDEVAEFNIIYVLDDARRLVGVIALRDLLRAASQTHIDELMITHIIKVAPSARLFELGGLFAKYGIRAIPVVDDGGVFLGTVRLKDVLYELVPQLRE
jgi:magnesium transporter